MSSGEGQRRIVKTCTDGGIWAFCDIFVCQLSPSLLPRISRDRSFLFAFHPSFEVGSWKKKN